MFLFPATAALTSGDDRVPRNRGKRVVRLSAPWIFATAALALLIGFRTQVGGDWDNYLAFLERIPSVPFREAVTESDPSYYMLTMISADHGWGVYGVNAICGAIFAVGLSVFSRGLPRPWLALTVAMPYLVIVVAMGYTRQAVALSLAMLGLYGLQRGSTAWFVFCVLVGATFHKSAVLLLPIAALSSSKNRYWTTLWVAVVLVGAYVVLLEDSAGALYVNYVEAEYQSDGAWVRGLMNALPAALVLVRWKRFAFASAEGRLWRWFSIISLALVGVLLMTPASTAVDRLALYMLPLQLVVFSHLPDVFGRPGGRNGGWVRLIVAYYAIVLVVWLNFATHAEYWKPYRFYPFERLL